MMLKIIVLILCAGMFLATCQDAAKKENNTKINIPQIEKNDSDGSGFYSSKFLESDYKQVDAAVYVNVKERVLTDQVGDGDCENNEGVGYCLYLLKADVKEVFKGEIAAKTLEFYKISDIKFPKNDLMGEKVIFLTKSDNYPDKKMSFGTLENSTRSIKNDVIEKMRKIAQEN